MSMCMILMVIQKELSTTENPWSFQQRYFLTNNTRAVGRNGTTQGTTWQRKVFISLGNAG